MTLVALTVQDPDHPHVLVNPAQVCTIKGRKGYRPDVTSHQGGIQSFPQGAEVALSNGDKLNVTESLAEAHAKLFPDNSVAMTPPPPKELHDKPKPPAKKVAAAPQGGAAKTDQDIADLFAQKD